jgi:hypothetical protein
MDVSTDTTMPRTLLTGLLVLVPFLIFGHVFQVYNAWTLWQIIQKVGVCHEAIQQSSFFFEWHAAVTALIFFILGTGNLITTALVLVDKFRR